MIHVNVFLSNGIAFMHVHVSGLRARNCKEEKLEQIAKNQIGDNLDAEIAPFLISN